MGLSNYLYVGGENGVSTGTDAFDDRLAPGVSRYDLVLVVIPLAFAAALVARGVFSVSLHASVLFASVVGGLAVADALFLHPPRTR